MIGGGFFAEGVVGVVGHLLGGGVGDQAGVPRWSRCWLEPPAVMVMPVDLAIGVEGVGLLLLVASLP